LLGSLSFGKVITGFINYKTAEGLSDRSVDSCRRILEYWAEFAGNKSITQFTDHDINSYLVYMRAEYIPSRWSGDTRNLSPKTLRNIWMTMCYFFRWANSEFHIESPMKDILAPHFQKVEIEPFTRVKVARMVKACLYSRGADTTNRRQFVIRRPTANRDRAVILMLLDSCVRASEFRAFRVGAFEPQRGKFEIRHGVEGVAKGGKGRMVYLGKTAKHALWRNLAERENGEAASAPLFVVRQGRPFNP
jgi:integrase/recombinase XerD